MKKIILVIIMFFFLVSCSSEKTNKIQDGLIDQFEIAFSYSGYNAGALYLDKNDLSLDDMYEELIENKYNVKYSESYDGRTCLIVDFFINDKNTSLFITEDGNKYKDNVFCVKQMILGKKNVYFSFPINYVSYTTGLEIYEGDDKITSAYVTGKTFEDMLYFYRNQSLCEILNCDLEEKTIIVQAVDTKKEKKINSSVKIYYKTTDEFSYITFDIL